VRESRGIWYQNDNWFCFVLKTYTIDVVITAHFCIGRGIAKAQLTHNPHHT
jgi:hypothetical protein